MKRFLILTLYLAVFFGCKGTGGRTPVDGASEGVASENPVFVFPQPDELIPLWPGGAPTDNGLTGEEIDYGNHVSNVTKPTLAVFLPEKPNGLAILVCPGGGYVDVWDKTEGYANSKWFTDQGIVYAVLKYRLPNGHYEVPLDDVHEAMRILEGHGSEYGFRKLGIAGCSAGGHLAATAATHFSNPEERPDFQILFYPVITMDPAFTHGGSSYYLLGQNPSKELLDEYSNEKKVTPETPPAFIMANSDDRVVPCENSLRYYEALRANGVSAALHVYPVGGHGWTDHTDFIYRDAWMNDLRIWLSQMAE
jgi:acetyl esterase/lipase